MNQHSKSSSRAERIYRMLLKLYPKHYRRLHGEALLGCFLDLHRETAWGRSRPANLFFWVRTLTDILWNASLLHLFRKRLARPYSGESVMKAIGQDFVFAWRKLRRNPLLTVVAVLTLALGIGANSAIFSALEVVLLRPLPYQDADRLVIVWPDNWFSKSEYDHYRKGYQSLRGLAAVQPESITLTGHDEPERLDGIRVSAGIFGLLGVQPSMGRPFTLDEDRPGGGCLAVVSHRLWQRRFGGDGAQLGRQVRFDGEPCRIVGVLPAGFYLPLEADVWLPLQIDPARRDYENTSQLKILARLAEGASTDQASRELHRLAQQRRQLRPDLHSDQYGQGAQVLPIRSAMLSDFQSPLIFLQAAVAFVLLMACANIANLLLASGAARRQELAVRAALGARRARLIRQLLSESLLLSALSGLAGIGIAHWGIAAMTLPQGVPSWVRIEFNWTVLLWTVAVCLLSGLFFGILPAFKFSRPQLFNSLQHGRRIAGDRRRLLQKTLIGCEVALAVILTSGAALMLQSFWKHASIDPGFDPRGVLTLRLHPSQDVLDSADQRRAFYGQVKEKVSALPSVQSAALAQHVSLSGLYWITLVDVQGQPSPGDRGIAMGRIVVGPDYFPTLGIPLLNGRGFEAQDSAAMQPVIVINQAMQRRFWPAEDPIGKRIRMHSSGEAPWLTVVGLVGDERFERLDAAVRPRFYQLHEQFPMRTMSLLIRAEAGTDPLALAASAREAVWGVDKRVPISGVRLLEEVVSDSVAVPRLMAQFLSAFGLLALVLGSGGIYGVVAYSVSRQRQEFGVRMALGANRRQILKRVMGQGMRPVLAGLAVGWLAALALGRAIESLLFGIPAHDPATLTLVPAVLLLVAAAACLLPARQATQVDPLIALRCD